jgi:carbon-monoxide dehydrogenase large subunit
VRVIARDVGGNFGTRNSSYPEFALVAWAARRLGRPVKWTGERQEAFLSDHQARDLQVEAEIALDAERNFLALRSANLSNLGAYAASFVPLTKGTELMSSLYQIPAARVRARAVLSNTPPTSPYRSAGRPEVMFVIERLIDRAARANGFDRVALRRKNLIPAASLPYANPFGMTYDSGEYHAVLDRAVALADWDGFAARRAEAEAARPTARHWTRRLCRVAERRAARTRGGYGAPGRHRRDGHRHLVERPGPRDELCAAAGRVARGAAGDRPARHWRH